MPILLGLTVINLNVEIQRMLAQTPLVKGSSEPRFSVKSWMFKTEKFFISLQVCRYLKKILELPFRSSSDGISSTSFILFILFHNKTWRFLKTPSFRIRITSTLVVHCAGISTMSPSALARTYRSKRRRT